MKKQAWSIHFQNWQASKLNKKNYCEQNQLSYPSFIYYSRVFSQVGIGKFKKINAPNASQLNSDIYFPNGIRLSVPISALDSDFIEVLKNV